MRNKATLTFLALAFIMALGSCAKQKQVKKDIEGSWTMTEILVDGVNDWQPIAGESWIWTFDGKTITQVETDWNGIAFETITNSTEYEIINVGEVLSTENGDYTINELTSTALFLEFESPGYIQLYTFIK